MEPLGLEHCKYKTFFVFTVKIDLYSQNSLSIEYCHCRSLKPVTSQSHTHTHTLHPLRKWLVHLSKSPTGTQGGARGLLQQLHSKLTQPLHPVILGDPPCGNQGRPTRPRETMKARPYSTYCTPFRTHLTLI